MTADAVWQPYTQMQSSSPPLKAVRTEGSRIWLEDGRCLVDGVASWWTACHGYNHPAILAAVEAQLRRMPHIMLGGFVHEPVLELSGRLRELLPGDLDHCFFSESGSVAVEVAMKIARQYWLNRGVRGRHRFLCFRHAYHGDTFAAMSVCDPAEGMHALFADALEPQELVEVPRDEADFRALEVVIAREQGALAGLIIEPLVQCAGGFRFHSPEVLRRVVEIARAAGLLVIFDEIATGFGRTGTMFACEQAGVVPDIVTLSKALTGGTMPLAATVARWHVYEAFLSDRDEAALMHGPTYSGNPLACAAANASLELFRTEPRLAQVAAIETQLRAGLEACRGMPGVADVRVKGAIGVVELGGAIDLEPMRAAFVDAGVWIRPFGRFVYLMPALNIAGEDLNWLVDAITGVLASNLASDNLVSDT